jgi:hypothetical protein
MNETKSAIAKESEKKNVLPVQQAIDAGTKTWTETLAKLGPAATAAADAVAALTKHAAAEAAKAAAAAADPAAKDPETVKTQDATASIPLAFTDKNAVDEAGSAAGLDRLTRLLGSCDALKVEATGTAADEKAGKARADAVKKLMEGKGLKGKITATAGGAGDGALSVKVTTPCP